MLKFGNKEFRNLQEQVEENMKDIANIKLGEVTLSEFGIKVVGEVADIDDVPTVLEYKAANPDWEYGDAYAVGTESPYTLYILTRANDTNPADYWFDIGEFPAVGPQGPQGPQGEQGVQGETGPQGANAGFGTVTATATTLASGSAATASVTTSGTDTTKNFAFEFGIPQNTPAGFTHYVSITASTIVGGQYTGTLGQSEYNTLYDNYDSVVVLNSSSSLSNNKYFLKKWYTSDDYIVFIGVWSLNNNDTRYYLLSIDRSNRNWTLDVGQPIKITSYNINSTTATNGQVLTADGNGGASWQDGGNGVEIVTLTQSTSTLSDDDYDKLNGDNAIIKFVSSGDGWTKYFKKYKDDGTYIYYYQVSQEEGSGTFFGGFRIVKSTKYCASLNSYLKVSTSNINSGSTIADQYLTSNGSGGASWTSGPSFTQVQSNWNESSISSPAYIQNKPTIPTVPVQDVTVNGTSVLDGTTAKVLVDTVSGVSDGTNWTSLTVNGTTAAIPQGGGGGSADVISITTMPGTFSADDLTKALKKDTIIDYSGFIFRYSYETSSQIRYETLTRNNGIKRITITKSTGAYALTDNGIYGSSLSSESATQGQVLTANGSGASAWANIEGTNIASTGATSGYVLTANGSGGTSWASAGGGGGGGGGGTTLNEYTYSFGINGENWTTILNILNNAKGRIKGYISFRFGIWSGSQNFSVNINSMRATSSTNIDISEIQYKQNGTNTYWCLIYYNGVASTGSVRVYTLNESTGTSAGSNTADRCNGGSITYWNDTQLHT